MPGQIDQTSLLECDEQDGFITSVKKRAYVSGIALAPENRNHRALYAALEEAGVPAKWTQLDNESGQHLLLSRRSAKLADSKDTGAYHVDLTYEHVHREHSQNLRNPVTNIDNIGAGVIFGEVRSSVREVETNRAPKFVATGAVTADNGIAGLNLAQYDGNKAYPIVAAHRPTAGPGNGNVVLQGGKVKVFKPNSNWTVSGHIATLSPWEIEAHYLGNVNRDMFMGRSTRTVMCTEVRYKLAGRSSAFINNAAIYYFFSFEFQHDPEGFDPVVVYNDPTTNRPPPNANPVTGGGIMVMTGNNLEVHFPMANPANLAAGVHTYLNNRQLGIYRLAYYREKDFNIYIAKPENPNVPYVSGIWP